MVKDKWHKEEYLICQQNHLKIMSLDKLFLSKIS